MGGEDIQTVGERVKRVTDSNLSSGLELWGCSAKCFTWVLLFSYHVVGNGRT